MIMSVCLSVCPLAYLENHTAELHQFFVRVACGRVSITYSSDGVVIRYVFPVLWMTSCFHVMGRRMVRRVYS